MKFNRTRIAKAVAMVSLALAPIAAYADPVTLIAYVAGTLFASKALFVAIVLVGRIYGGMDARRRRRHAAMDARNAYNSSLLDRNTSALTATPPWRARYGRCIAGGDVVHILTSDKLSYREDGTTYTKPDAYKHLVVEIAHHEVSAIHNTIIDGVPVGALDGSGYPVAGEFVKVRNDSRFGTISGGVINVGQPVIQIVNAYTTIGWGEYQEPVNVIGSITLTSGNTVINGPDGAIVNYVVDASTRSVRIQTHLGTDAQTVDTFLNGLFPTEWDSTHRLRGAAYVVITLDLEDVRWQGGIPNPTFDVSGKKCFDPRTSTTVYTQNPALHIRDWLISEWGYGVDAADIDDVAVIASANACDVRASAAAQAYAKTLSAVSAANNTISFTDDTWFNTGDGVRFTTTGSLPAPLALATTYYIIRDLDLKTYRLATTLANAFAGTAIDITSAGSGTITCTLFDYATYEAGCAFSTDDGKESFLDELADSMAGQAVCTGLWLIQAGAWTTPVMDLTEADLDGVISIVHGDTDLGELFNGMRGLYVPIGQSTAADYQSYQNATFLAADGKPLWDNKNFPFTDRKFKARNLCRIFTERNRNGQTIYFPAKLRAWPLQVGDRVRVTSAEYGWTLKEFQVIDWQFGLSSVVGLTLVEDAAAVYDLADATTADPTRNTDLPNPWVVAQLVSVAASSSLLRQADGTFAVKTTVTWNASTDAYVLNGSGRIVVNWRRQGSETVWRREETAGDSTSLTFTGAREGDILTLEVFALNSNKEPGPPVYISHTVPITIPANSNADNAFVVHGTANSMLVAGSTVRKVGGTGAWDAGAYSKAPIRGACSVSFVNGGGGSYMIALNADPTADASYTSLDFAWYIGSAGSTAAEIYESGALAVTGITIAASGDQFRIRYTGNTIEYWQNDVLRRVKAVPPGTVFYLDSSFFSVGAEAQSLVFTPDTPSPTGNLIDSSTWKVGTTGSQGSSTGAPGTYFPAEGGTAENSISLSASPDGMVRPVWNGFQSNSGSTEVGGGWIDPGNIPIDNTQMYRLAVWWRASAPMTDGTLYLGPSVNVNDIPSGTLNTNPYNIIPNRAAMVPGRWYLAVGYIYPSGYADAQLNQSGIWDGVTGQKVQIGSDFKWVAGALTGGMRTFQYYAALNSVDAYWGPRFEMCNGSEPGVQQLLAPALALTQDQGRNPFDFASALNGSFSRWQLANTYPDGWALWGNAAGISREVTNTADGPNAVRMVTSSLETGIGWIWDMRSIARQPANTFVEGTVLVYVVNNVSGGVPGIYIQLWVDAGLSISRSIFFPIDKTASGWQPVPFKIGVNPGEVIYYINVYLMAGWTGAPGGVWNGTMIFDKIAMNFVQPSNTTHIVDGAVTAGANVGQNSTSVAWTNSAAAFDPWPSSGDPPGYQSITHAARQSYLIEVEIDVVAQATSTAGTHAYVEMVLSYRGPSGSGLPFAAGGFSLLKWMHAPVMPDEVGGGEIAHFNRTFVCFAPGSAYFTEGSAYKIGVYVNQLKLFNGATLIAPGASSSVYVYTTVRVITRTA